jgi:hypothetical protein
MVRWMMGGLSVVGYTEVLWLLLMKEDGMKPLQGKVAVVAGATRGAGRGIACMLGSGSATWRRYEARRPSLA